MDVMMMSVWRWKWWKLWQFEWYQFRNWLWWQWWWCFWLALVGVCATFWNWGVVVIAGHHWPRTRENLGDGAAHNDNNYDNDGDNDNNNDDEDDVWTSCPVALSTACIAPAMKPKFVPPWNLNSNSYSEIFSILIYIFWWNTCRSWRWHSLQRSQQESRQKTRPTRRCAAPQTTCQTSRTRTRSPTLESLASWLSRPRSPAPPPTGSWSPSARCRHCPSRGWERGCRTWTVRSRSHPPSAAAWWNEGVPGPWDQVGPNNIFRSPGMVWKPILAKLIL